ncbi:TPA: hypothetical protein VTK53_001009 [Streptococcus pneumoniae]|nr:hypothetical protein AZK03_06185 [Streptococcus pneumoniae]HES9474573.1 hypothetical protein [Streptococcus pneumoniae]HES9647841.1 hypothetical protein [Streptococcus pneumoniae]HET3110904.1 hypothetical protein [Streptococcus pneumoniae]HET3656852.1 hypothetical protein [Streptococcus pneumoniae]
MTQEDALIVISHIKVLSIVPNRCLKPLDKTFSLYNWIFLSQKYIRLVRNLVHFIIDDGTN